jgi:hypothetical protein
MIGSLGLLQVPIARALDVQVSAEYKPDIREPTRLSFVNTTRNQGNCAVSFHTPKCEREGVVGIKVPISGTKLIENDNIDNRLYLGLPGVRSIAVVNSETGRAANVNLYMAGGTVRLRIAPSEPRPESPIGAETSGVCRVITTGTEAGGLRSLMMLLVRDNQASEGACYNTGMRVRQLLDITEFEFVFRIEADSPLSLPSGTYTGSARYIVGQDFTFGANVNITSDPIIDVHFTLTVEHQFAVTFPTASPKVNLAPVGGWQQWTDYGRAPSRLQQELPFALTTSNDFSLKMRCDHYVGERCGIENAATGDLAAIDVEVTMPGMRDVLLGTPAVNYALATDRAGGAIGGAALRFTPDSYLASRPSKLTFSANGDAVTEMLKSPGSRWQGDVTVVFDSDP